MNQRWQALWSLSEAAPRQAQAESGPDLSAASPAAVDPLLLELRQRFSDAESTAGRVQLEGHAAWYDVSPGQLAHDRRLAPGEAKQTQRRETCGLSEGDAPSRVTPIP